MICVKCMSTTLCSLTVQLCFFSLYPVKCVLNIVNMQKRVLHLKSQTYSGPFPYFMCCFCVGCFFSAHSESKASPFAPLVLAISPRLVITHPLLEDILIFLSPFLKNESSKVNACIALAGGKRSGGEAGVECRDSILSISPLFFSLDSWPRDSPQGESSEVWVLVVLMCRLCKGNVTFFQHYPFNWSRLKGSE